MSHVTGSSTDSRIHNIHQFLQGSNPLGIAEDSAKALLALEEACGELASNEQVKRYRNESSTPKLTPPKMTRAAVPALAQAEAKQETKFNANATLIEAFASIRQLLHDGNINALNSRLQLINFESESLRHKGSQLLESFSQSTSKLAELTNTVDKKQKEIAAAHEQIMTIDTALTKTENGLQSNDAQLQTVQMQLDEVEQLMTLVPTPPMTLEDKSTAKDLLRTKNELLVSLTQLTNEIQQLSSLKGQLIEQRVVLNQKIDIFDAELVKTLNLSVDVAKESSNHRENLNTFIDEAPRLTEVDGEKWENTLALLTMLTAQLKKAMNEDSLRNMKEQEETMMKINEASRKDSDKKAKEAAEAERKAADSNKAASCASKIFSYVMLAVSVIATVATFGAASPLMLAVAAIGIAISVADIVLEETGHGSLMQMLANEISIGVTDMLVSFGMDEDKAKQIGSIVGMIVAAIAFLAISLFSMGSMLKNIASTVKNVAQLVLKNVGNLLKSSLKAIPKNLLNALSNIGSKGMKMGDSVADSADSMAKLTQMTKLADKFDDAEALANTVNHVTNNIKKSTHLVSIGGQMVNVGDAVADSASNAAKLSKFAKIADKFDDIEDWASTANQVTNNVNKSSNLVSIGGQMVNVGDSVADSATNAAKLTKFTKIADKFDDVKDASKTVNQSINQADDAADITSFTDTSVKSVNTQSVTMARVEVGMKAASAGLSISNAATTGGLRLDSAAKARDLKELLAGMMLNSDVIEAITEIINQLIKAMSKNHEQFDEMFTGMMSSLKDSSSRKANMLAARYA